MTTLEETLAVLRDRGYKTGGRRLRTVSTEGIEPRPTHWIWDGRIPIGEMTITAGFGGVGKSTFHAYIVAGLTRGTLPGKHFGTPKPVLLYATEDSWARSIVPHLIAANADRKLVMRGDVEQAYAQVQLSLPADVGALAETILAEGYALVSIDPLLSAIGEDLDPYKSRDVRQALEPLQRAADAADCAILANAHFNKTAGGNALLRVSGSTAFGEVARAVLTFAWDKTNEGFVVTQTKNNLGKPNLPSLAYQLESVFIDTTEGKAETARFVLVGESDRHVDDLLDSRPESLDQEDTDTRGLAREHVLSSLTDGPKQWAEIAKGLKAEGIAERTGRRARDELKKEGKIGTRQTNRAWEWYRDDEAASGTREAS